MGLILDTSALVALERAGAPLTDVLAPLSEEEVAVPAIVVASGFLGFTILVGPQDEEHFRRVEGIEVETLKQ